MVTEYDNVIKEKQSLVHAYLETVKVQERVLVDGEAKKARIRTRLDQIEQRLAEIRGS